MSEQHNIDYIDLISRLVAVGGFIFLTAWSIVSCEPSSKTPKSGGGIECSGGRYQDCFPSEESEVDYMLDKYKHELDYMNDYDGSDQIPW